MAGRRFLFRPHAGRPGPVRTGAGKWVLIQITIQIQFYSGHPIFAKFTFSGAVFNQFWLGKHTCLLVYLVQTTTPKPGA